HPRPLDPAENAVDETCGVVGRIPLRQLDGFADRDLVRNLVPPELVDCDPQHVPLDRAQALGRPALRDVADASVELLRPLGDLLGALACERIYLALVARRERLSRHVPRVQPEARRPARGAAGRPRPLPPPTTPADASRQ